VSGTEAEMDMQAQKEKTPKLTLSITEAANALGGRPRYRSQAARFRAALGDSNEWRRWSVAYHARHAGTFPNREVRRAEVHRTLKPKRRPKPLARPGRPNRDVNPPLKEST
jgi:hypothetical protein